MIYIMDEEKIAGPIMKAEDISLAIKVARQHYVGTGRKPKILVEVEYNILIKESKNETLPPNPTN